MEWNTTDTGADYEGEGFRLQVQEAHSGDDVVWSWEVLLWDEWEGDYYHCDSGTEDTLEAAKAAVERMVDCDPDDGDDMDGDHGTALASAGYGDESFGYECGDWL